MNYNDAKQILIQCPGLSELDELSQAFLLRHGDEMIFNAGEIIYAEGAELDDSFCILLSGSVAVEKGGKVVAESARNHVFGDMAYFSPRHKRSATVRVTSPQAAVLKISLPSGSLGSPPYASLKKHLALQPWKRPVD
jgi:CRP-like cAMP-binding protein